MPQGSPLNLTPLLASAAAIVLALAFLLAWTRMVVEAVWAVSCPGRAGPSPMPASALHLLLQDHRTRHRRGLPAALQGIEGWL
jgi:hypothetical protein